MAAALVFWGSAGIAAAGAAVSGAAAGVRGAVATGAIVRSARATGWADLSATGRAGSAFVADTPELESVVRALASELHGLLVEARGQEYYSLTVEAAPLTQGTPIVTLAPDFMALLAVRIAGPGYTVTEVPGPGEGTNTASR